MRKMNVLFALLFAATTLAAQEYMYYNKDGDSSMALRQYDDAKIHYSKGLDKCDKYSIKQLTKIWLNEESMRLKLDFVMRQCRECLINNAKQQDSTAMKMLIQYYSEGIGTEIDEESADTWKSKLQSMRYPQLSERGAAGKSKTKMRFFAGYSASQWAPYGLTIGVAGKTFGGYLRYRTNFVSINPDEGLTCYAEQNTDPKLEGDYGDYAYRSAGRQQSGIWMGTGGIVIRASEKFHISVGGGYWKRDVAAEFELIDMDVAEHTKVVWAKRTDISYSGAVVDLDATLRLGKTFYVSLGGSAFNFKYVYANAGLGVFF